MTKATVFWAYTAVMLGVFGNASSEFVAVLTGLYGPEQSVWRFFLGGFGLVVVSLCLPRTRDLITPLRQSWAAILSVSIFGMTFGQLLFHWSLAYASVAQVATVVTTMPILVVLVDRVINRAPVTLPKLVSGAGAFVGVVLLLTDGYLGRLAGETDAFYGVLLALGCAVAGACYLVLVRPQIVRYGAIRMTTYTFALGGFVLWPVVGLGWGLWVDPTTLFDRPAGEAAAILTMGLWNTTLTMILWLWGLSAVPDMARASYTFFLKPVIAAGLAYVFLSQPLTAMQLGAIAAICSCVAVEIFWDRLRALFRVPTAG
jgi:drug/metabolite transporter (DMT)-like permease